MPLKNLSKQPAYLCKFMGKRKRSRSLRQSPSKTLSCTHRSCQTIDGQGSTCSTTHGSVSSAMASAHNVMYGSPTTTSAAVFNQGYQQNYPYLQPVPLNQQAQQSFPPPAFSPQNQAFTQLAPPFQQSEKTNIECLIQEMNNKLSKLDILDKIVERLDALESRFTEMEKGMSFVKQELREHTDKIEGNEFHYNILEERVEKMERERDHSQRDLQQMQDKMVDLQTRSMRNNLLFGGIREASQEADTEAVLKEFIKTELDIEDANEIKFEAVHRLRPRRDGKPRSIVARFESRRDRDRILRAAPTKLLNKREYTINEQYPSEINERRQLLFPIMREARRNGKTAKLRGDKLYIDGSLYNPERGTNR